MKPEILETLRQPEYTGENRCEPCTILNLVIAAVLGSVVARRSKIGGILAFGFSVGLIYLRGYLVPGTPALTKRYLPPEILRWFGKESEPTIHSGFGSVDVSTQAAASSEGTDPDASDGRMAEERDTSADAGADDTGDADAVAAETADENGDKNDDYQNGGDSDGGGDDDAVLTLTPEVYFLENEVVEPCDEIDDLCLTEEFETEWFDEIDAIDVDAVDGDDAAAAFGFDADDETFELDEFNNASVLRRDGTRIGTWPSRAALVADVTAASVLEAWDDEWKSYKPEEKGPLLNSLRLFLETCPTSGGEVVLGEETVESCCHSRQVVAVTCADTNERLFEHAVENLEA